MARGKRFSIFDAMEDAGMFRANPANADSVTKEGVMLYTGPVSFPMMVYHPFGEERIIVPGTAENTPFGPKMVGEQREIIWKLVANQAEYREATESGWHDHPAKGIAAGNARLSPDQAHMRRAVPPISSATTIDDLTRRLRETEEALALAKSSMELGAVEKTNVALGPKLKADTSAKGLA